MRLLICQRALRVFAIAVVIAWCTRPIGAQVTDSARAAAASVADTMTTWGSVDHLGVAHEIDTRNELQLHRVQVFFKGWMYLPKFRSAITIWTVDATQQVAVVGTLTYEFSKQFRLSGGVHGLPGTRPLGGSHPYWLGADRVMADGYSQLGFTSGMWATGEALPRVIYTAMVGDTLSQLGITAGQLTRNLATGATIWWVPTTGEFGPRGAYGDSEGHQQLAKRSAFDAGVKYRGAFLQTEYSVRRLDRFAAALPVPIHAIVDRGWMLQASYTAVPKRFEFYAGTSQIDGQFNRPWEVLGGANWYPDDARNLRVNVNAT